GRASLPRAVASLAEAAKRLGGDERAKAEQAVSEYQSREQRLGRFVAAYRQYCWTVASLTDLKVAPFHLLASEGRVHTDKSHPWHMDTLAKVCREAPELLLATSYKVIDVTDPAKVTEGAGWWTDLTGRGGEGKVVKQRDVILR